MITEAIRTTGRTFLLGGLLAAVFAATVLGAAGELPGGGVIARPPETVERVLSRLRDQLREAEGALVSHDHERAARIVGEVDASLAALRQEHGAEIPTGHVALFVIEERVLILKRDLTDRR
jgi:microcompartment protein CcmL/EutN